MYKSTYPNFTYSSEDNLFFQEYIIDAQKWILKITQMMGILPVLSQYNIR